MCYGDTRRTIAKKDEYVGDDSNRELITASEISEKCPFYLSFIYKDGVHTLYKSCGIHNHKLSYASKPIISAHIQETITNLKDKTKSVEALRDAINTAHNIDLNYQSIYYAKKKLLEKDIGRAINDAQNLVELAKKKNGFFEYNKDSNNFLNKFIYISRNRRDDFQIFNDVVVLDATLKTNHFNMPMVTFTGINSNGSNIPFGFGLLSNQTEQSYTWLLRKFLEIMAKEPDVIFSDDCPSIRAGNI